MKRYLLGVLIAGTVSMTASAQDAAFCDNLTKVLNSAQEYFNEVRGEETSLEIRGVPKAYNRSTVELKEGVEMLISEDVYYPEAVTYLTKARFYSSELESQYQKLKEAVISCIGDGWVTSEKDKTNDIFLEDTDFKKLIAKENKKGKKVKIELYMYNQRELNTWVVELKMYGIGRKI